MLRRLGIGVALLGVVVLLWTAVVLLIVRLDLASAREALEDARRSQNTQAADLALRDATDDLVAATNRMGQPGVRLAAVVPVLGRHVEAVDRSAEAALAVARGTRAVLAATVGGSPLLSDGALDVTRMQEVAEALRRAEDLTRRPVQELIDQPDGLLVQAVSGPLEETKRELAGVPEQFGSAASGVGALADVLGADRPRSLLIVFQNNAELRATGGLVSVFAEASASEGRLEIGAFRDVEDVAAPAAQAKQVPAPAEFEELWGRYLADTTLWKNTNMAPDVATSSEVLVEVAAASLSRRPDAVLWFDVPAVAAILGATGPATLPDGTELRGDNAVEVLLSRAYMNTSDDDAGQEERRRALRAAADAVLGGLLGRTGGGDVPLVSLAGALGDAAAGRHLAVWSADPVEQGELLHAGLAGEVRAGQGDLHSFTVHNLGGGDPDGNKLDFYARRSVAVRAVVGVESAVIEQEIVLANDAPEAGLPTYVAGTGSPGTTHNLVAVAVPRGADSLEFSRGGLTLDVEPLPSGDHSLLLDVIRLPPGTSASWKVRYRQPVVDGRYELQVVPQPLAFDASLAVEIRSSGDERLQATAQGDLQADAAGVLRHSGPFASTTSFEVAVQRPTRLRRAGQAVARFWNEPVELP